VKIRKLVLLPSSGVSSCQRGPDSFEFGCLAALGFVAKQDPIALGSATQQNPLA
jgi:hypothetical protein